MWKFQGRELQESDIPPKAVGFIYIITQISTGKLYVGRKLLTFASSKVVKGVKKKTRVTSNWKDYWSSSPFITEYIKEHGTDDFTKEIIVFSLGKGAMAYMEECLLYSLGALESTNWLNENIRAKVYRTWIKDKPEITVMRNYIEAFQKESSSSSSQSASASISPQKGQ